MSSLLKIRFEKDDVVCVVQEFVVPAVLHGEMTKFRIFVDGGILPSGDEFNVYVTIDAAIRFALGVVEYLTRRED